MWVSPGQSTTRVKFRFRAGCGAIFLDVQSDQLAGFRPQLDLAEAVAFTQDGQGVIVGVKIVQIQRCDFSGPGAGVIQQLNEAVVAYGSQRCRWQASQPEKRKSHL